MKIKSLSHTRWQTEAMKADSELTAFPNVP